METKSGRAAPKPRTWEEALTSLPPQDRDFLQQVADRYHGALGYRDAGERRRLEHLGFPTAEEWLDARHRSDAALETAFRNGDMKAGMFLADRKLTALSAAQQSRKAGAAQDAEVIRHVGSTLGTASELMRRSASPFAAYIYGLALSAATPDSAPEPVAASFLVALDRGDWRADQMAQQFARRQPQVNNSALMSCYSVMKGLHP